VQEPCEYRALFATALVKQPICIVVPFF